MNEKICKNCKHWLPRYYQVGQCLRDGSSHSKIWINGSNDARIYTAQTFGCTEYEEPPKASEGTV